MGLQDNPLKPVIRLLTLRRAAGMIQLSDKNNALAMRNRRFPFAFQTKEF
jgi:hypothetical protein